MPEYRMLLASGLISALLHLAIFAVPLQPDTVTANQHESISAALISPPSIQGNLAKTHHSDTNEAIWRGSSPSSEEYSAKSATDEIFSSETYFGPSETAFGSRELDSPVRALTEPDFEPPEGYPRDVHGTATLTLLIDKDGHVLWSNLDSTEFEAEINERITKAFAQTKFSPPYKSGRPTRVILKIQVNIGAI